MTLLHVVQKRGFEVRDRSFSPSTFSTSRGKDGIQASCRYEIGDSILLPLCCPFVFLPSCDTPSLLYSLMITRVSNPIWHQMAHVEMQVGVHWTLLLPVGYHSTTHWPPPGQWPSFDFSPTTYWPPPRQYVAINWPSHFHQQGTFWPPTDQSQTHSRHFLFPDHVSPQFLSHGNVISSNLESKLVPES